VVQINFKYEHDENFYKTIKLLTGEYTETACNKAYNMYMDMLTRQGQGKYQSNITYCAYVE